VAIKVRWEGGHRFVGETETGVRVTMEPGPKYGGSGKNPTPMEMVAMAHGGCTGLDVVMILEKMRVKVARLEIDVETKRREEPPNYFEEIKLTYTVSGEGVTEENVRRAASLSHEKYCSVGAMLAGKAKISYEIKIV
jgi:putative redox protein